ncbi:hypothetical protein [Asticcacaulis sp. YBE204]|uniref:hypothetical protein n=1 Tax=Asticcacaulis sp. YBE204 TaxID=1282363 RepID=UPI0003C3DF99|nr:hypothetical protein [Asticcacaulis sp. YBE204]ESQ79099.1 hypothetical protein AEYBE204_11785 [Asticcacaulis sp. YBE204]
MKFTIGNVFSRAFDLMGRHFALIFGMAIVTVGIPTFAFSAYLVEILGQAPLDTDGFGFTLPTGSSAGLVLGLVSIILSLINYSMLTELAVTGLVGRKFELGAAIGRAFANILPLIVIGIIYFLAVAVGMILLIIPGIIIMVAMSPCFAIYIAERGIGITGAVSKSWALTENHRWALFFISLLVGIATGILSNIVQAPFLFMSASLSPTLFLGLTTLVGVAVNAITLVFSVTCYVLLRESKEGKTPESAADVFA